MRERFVMRNGKLVSASEAGPHPSAGRRLGFGPNTISDDLGADLEHHGYDDRRRTASKSEFRRWTKSAGLVEKGNDRERPKPARAPDIRPDVATALQMCKDGYRPQIRQTGSEGWHD